MSGQLGDLVVSFSADLAKFQSDMGKSVKIVEDSSQKMVGSFELVTGAISKIGAALVGGAIITGIAKMIDSAADWNIQAQRMANVMGLTTEAASVFEVAIQKLGIDHDTATNAALKLSRTLSQGTDKFDEYGVSVKDANGNLLPMPQIMANVNQALLETKSGADRNVMAMTLYGRSWGQLQEILRLTPEAMAAAQKTAERLHLIVGPEGVAKSYAYKEGINEVKLAGHSLAIAFGNELLPAIVSVTSAMNGANFAGTIGKQIKEVSRDIQEAAVFWAAAFDKIGAWFTYGGYRLITQAGRDEWKRQMAIIQDAEAKSLQDISSFYDNPPKKSTTPAGETVNIGSQSANKMAGAENAARNAYLAYEKAFNETRAQLNKQANDLEEQQNQNDWDWGLIGLKTYLDKKHKLQEADLQAELDAKKKEMLEAKTAEDAAKAAYNKLGGTGETAVALNKAYDTTQKTVIAYDAALSKLNLTIAANANENKKAQYEEQQNLNTLKLLINQQEYRATDVFESQFGQTQFDNVVKKYEDMYRKIHDLQVKFGADSVQAQNAQMGAQIDMVRDSTNLLASQLMKGNRDQFNAGKALAIAMATVDAAMAVVKALSSATPPMNYVNAAMVAAAAAAQIAAINSQQYSGRAMGGDVSANTPYIVGEKGPELFTPGASGMITPNDKLGGVNLEQHITIDARGSDQGVEQRIRVAMDETRRSTMAAIYQNMQRGGAFAVASGRLK